MNARRFQRAWAHGRRQAEQLEPRLQEQYEAAIRAAGARSVKAYKQAATVTLAAANPTMQEVLDARVLQESVLARTAATRKRIAEAASVVAVESPEARRLVSPLLQTLVDQQAGKQAARLVAGAEEAVAQVMLDSLTEGWSVPRTADALRERFSEFSRTQSTMLARTDLISLSNGASLATATSLGDEAPNFKTWLATNDDRTREDHAEADGQSVPFDQPFDVGGVPMMYPGDPDGPDDSTINCRCTLIYEDEPASQLLHSEEGGIQAAAPTGLARLVDGPRTPNHKFVCGEDGCKHEPLGGENLGSVQAAADVDGILEGDMPWKVVAREDEFCVVKSDTGETVKCHPTEEQALAHQKALYMNVDEEMTAATITAEQRRDWAESGIALPDGSYPIPNREYLQKAIGALGRASQNDEYDRVKRHIIKRARALNAISMLPEDWGITSAAEPEEAIIACPYCAENGCAQEAAAATGETASAACCGGTETADCLETLVGENPGTVLIAAIPVEPPSEWFEFPEASGPTPITITADGHIYGHAALWGTCHTGFPGRCRTAPPSPSNYRYYHLGAVDTADGKTIPVGNVTLRTGHASLTASRQEVAAHYDNTGLVGADVVAKDGIHGIWVTGALRPGVDEKAIRELKGAKLSGDWRGINGHLEMIGLLAVNVPGFPVPRPQAALAASAEGEDYVTALVAAGILGEPEDLEIITDDLFRSRLRALSARAGGLDELVALGLGETEQESRLRRMSAVRKVPLVTVESAPATPRIEVTVTVGGEQVDVMAFGDQMDREIAYRVAFFAEKGYWPSTPQSGAALSDEEWQVAQDAAAELVTDPDTEEMQALRQRLLDRGFLVT
jgi:F like protein